jgi:hypothetical protein
MAEQPHRESSMAEARAVAAYLTAVRAIVNEASSSRAVWIRQIGTLMKDGRDPERADGLAAEAGQIGQEQLAAFRAFHERLDRLQPPLMCEDCQMIVSGWLEKQMAACDVMIEVGKAGELSALRATQGLLADGRDDSRRFAQSYAELVAWLKERLAHARAAKPARRRSRIPWLRGR